jgi:CubicO group peptidase (beta-lactamase class C family)
MAAGRVAPLVAIAFALTVTYAGTHAQSTHSNGTVPEGPPESVGFSSERIQRLDQTMRALVEKNEFAGMVTILARHGTIVDLKTFGKQDLQTGAPMQRDTIFRIASMTKPVTGVAMMILYEEGRWRPEDPIAKHIPEFAELKVLGENGTLEVPRHPPTLGELMTHTAGFAYGLSTATAVDKMYVEQRVLQSASLQDFIAKLARIPLAYQPGTRWVYSASVDIQGYLVEKLSGKSLPDFMRERIFEPLGMTDTGFHVPDGKSGRLATIYSHDQAKGGLMPVAAVGNPRTPPSMPSGGGGLFSTPVDYWRFVQMLVNGGRLGAARILAPSSVELMTSNHLSDTLMAGGEFTPTTPNGIVRLDPNVSTAFGIAFYKVRPGIGFGYDVSVIYDPVRASRTVGMRTFHWDGAFGTWFWADPTNDLVFVGMIQRRDLGVMPNVQELARQMVYQALVDPGK